MHDFMCAYVSMCVCVRVRVCVCVCIYVNIIIDNGVRGMNMHVPVTALARTVARTDINVCVRVCESGIMCVGVCLYTHTNPHICTYMTRRCRC